MSEGLRSTTIKLVGKVAERDPNSISTSDLLVDDLGFDSLMLISLIVDIEQELGLEIPPEGMLPETFSTVGSVVAYLEELATRKSTEQPA